jgi:hypothetical protein
MLSKVGYQIPVLMSLFPHVPFQYTAFFQNRLAQTGQAFYFSQLFFKSK